MKHSSQHGYKPNKQVIKLLSNSKKESIIWVSQRFISRHEIFLFSKPDKNTNLILIFSLQSTTKISKDIADSQSKSDALFKYEKKQTESDYGSGDFCFVSNFAIWFESKKPLWRSFVELLAFHGVWSVHNSRTFINLLCHHFPLL